MSLATSRGVLSHVLSEMGYRVRTAEDGFSALAELRKEIPDILLSDLNMPGMSGFELLLGFEPLSFDSDDRHERCVLWR